MLNKIISYFVANDNPNPFLAYSEKWQVRLNLENFHNHPHSLASIKSFLNNDRNIDHALKRNTPHDNLSESRKRDTLRPYVIEGQIPENPSLLTRLLNAFNF